MIKLDRTRAKLIHGKEPEFPAPSPLPPSELVSMVWDLTVEAYSLAGKFDPNEPLRRDVVRVIRRDQYRKNSDDKSGGQSGAISKDAIDKGNPEAR